MPFAGAPAESFFLAVLTAVFWAGCLALFTHVLEYFHTLGDFGPL
jgi:hypothetical protein